MDSSQMLQYACRTHDVDYYRERPEDKDKPPTERRWEMLINPHIVVDIIEKLILFVGTEEEALAKLDWCQQASPPLMERLRTQARKRLAEIGPIKDTCTECPVGSIAGRWSSFRQK